MSIVNTAFNLGYFAADDVITGKADEIEMLYTEDMKEEYESFMRGVRTRIREFRDKMT